MYCLPVGSNGTRIEAETNNLLQDLVLGKKLVRENISFFSSLCFVCLYAFDYITYPQKA